MAVCGCWRLFLYLFVTFCAGIMSEPAKRNSTRERKPNRFLQLDDLDPPNHSTSRLPDPRDSRTAPENAQLARLLLRFVGNTNSKLREHLDRDLPQQDSHQPNAPDASRLPPSSTKGTERRPTATETGPQSQGRRAQDTRKPQEETAKSTSKPTDRKPQPPSRVPSNGPAELDFGAVRGKNPSSETQASGVGEQQMRSKADGQRKKKGVVLQRPGQREELKPFKRQSFHVAIAYHIYLRQVRPGEDGTPTRSDPTYPARRLREMQERQA